MPKQIPWMGVTLNLAKTAGVVLLLLILVLLFMIPLITTIVVLN